jgi:diguanylate cyclase (GGDEF)-like protein
LFRLAFTLIAAIVFFAPPASGATALEQTRAFETRAASNPKQAIVEASDELRKAEAAGDKAAKLRALRLLAMAYDALDDNPGLRDTVEAGLPLAIELGDKSAEVELTTAKATSIYNEGRLNDSIALHDQAIALASEAKLDRELAKARYAKAHVLLGQERSAEAVQELLKSHALLERLDEKLLLSANFSEMGNILARDDSSPEDLLRALDYHKRAMALLDPAVDKYEISTAYYNLGVVYSYLKDYDAAKGWLEKCLALGKELKDPQTIAFVNYRLGSNDLALKRYERAIARLEAALPKFRETENVVLEFLSQIVRAKAFGQLKSGREARDALAAAQVLAKKLDSPGRDVQYHEAAAQVHASLGEAEAAYEEMMALRDAERRVATAANQRVSRELQAQFDAKQRETENQLLRVEGKVQEARRLMLLMALGLTLLVALALVAYVVRQARQNRRFANLAMRDDLTGLPNRRSILEFAQLQFRGRRLGDSGVVLALLDLDHFKAINDELGHSVGDEVLKAFAQACLAAMRTEDRLGRFGGEEFLLVMPGTDIGSMQSVFDRLRAGVTKARANSLPEGRTLTFSMGATTANAIDPDLDCIIKRADDALYRAKHLGRDRYEVVQP